MAGMSSRHTTSRVILALCLVLFQVQILAASSLGCRHERSAPPVHCAHHLGVAGATTVDQAQGAPPLGCIKCDLVDVLQPAAAPGMSLASIPYRSAASTRVPLHFYRHCPEPSLRPPIRSCV